MSLDYKFQQLQKILSTFGSVAVAFSGGVDSTFLLKVASTVLGKEKVLALTAVSPIFPGYEIDQSIELATTIGVRHQLCASNQMEQNDFIVNGRQRCYHCKNNMLKLFLSQLSGSAATLLDGSNLDDQNDYRPGQKAVTQLQIRSPLLEAELSKQEIRELSQELKLPTWDKQPFACLATRIPYGDTITIKRLQRIDQCETWLRLRNFTTYRVRCHGKLARIEVSAADMLRLLMAPLQLELIEHFKQNGFDYTTIDLQGYRSGSMNEALPQMTLS